MYIYNEYIVTDDAEFRSVMSVSRNKKAYPENLIMAFSVDIGDGNNFEKLIKNLRNAPPRSFSGNVVRYFSDFFSKILLDLEKKYAEPLDKQGPDMLSLFLADRNEVHIMPAGEDMKIYFRIGGEGFDAVMRRYAELKEAVLGLIQQYSEV